MPKTNTPTAEAFNVNGPHGRRKFLARAIVGGVAGAFAAPLAGAAERGARQQPTDQTTKESDVCDVPPSAADALDRQGYILLLAQFQVSNALLEKSKGVLHRCGDLFLRLRTKLKKLETLLREKPQGGAREQLRQMRDLVGLGQSQMTMLKASAAAPAGSSLATTLAVVSQGVGQAAQGLLPKEPAIIDDDVRTLVNEILEIIRESEPLQKEVSDTQTAVNKSRADFDNLMQRVLTHIKNATEQVLIAEVPPEVEIYEGKDSDGKEKKRVITPEERNTARRNAISRLSDALKLMEELKKATQPLASDALETIRLAEFLLDGTYIWIQVDGGVAKPQSTRKVEEAARGPRGAAVLKAAYAEPGQSLIPRPPELERKRISTMLWQHCMRGGEWNAAALVASALNSTAYSVWLWSFTPTPWTMPGIRKEVLLALANLKEVKCQSSDKDFHPNVGALATALAQYVIQRCG